MIAVDTNVLVRYLTNDDAEQARKAVAVLGGPDSVLGVLGPNRQKLAVGIARLGPSLRSRSSRKSRRVR